MPTSRLSSVLQCPWRCSGLLVLATLAAVGIVSPYSLITFLLEFFRACAVLLPAALAGLWIVPLFRVDRREISWHLILGAALGIGALSLLVLLLGLAGLLQTELWWGIQVVLAILGAWRLWLLRSASDDGAPGEGLAKELEATDESLRWLWLAVVPFAVLAILAATAAPGFLWAEEGFGYDVLEYHLQLPKEHFQAGAISYCRHNVYANFPAGVEMLYLVAMVLFRETWQTGVTAQVIHLLLACLTVAAAWRIGRSWSPRAGTIAGVVTGTVGWLPYLSGLAYVEHGLLLLGLLAMGVLLVPSGFITGWRRYVLAGVLAGLACGCKYTAVPMIVLPLLFVCLLLPAPRWPQRFAGAGLFLLAAILVFAPWLGKNLVATGNPVFPLANGVFQASPPGWDAKADARWTHGHRLPPEESSLQARAGLLWRHVFADKYQRFGPLVLLLGLVGMIGRRRDRVDAALLLVLALQLLVWVFATHLYARFAVVLLIPLVLLAGRGALPREQKLTPVRARRYLLLAAILAGALFNLFIRSGNQLAGAIPLFRQEWINGAAGSLFADGRVPGFEYLGAINDLPPDAHVLLVGEARPFYMEAEVSYAVVFNEDPFAQAVARSDNPDAVVSWLREQGYTHIFVNWMEISRLRGTYGLSDRITPALFAGLESAGLHPIRQFALPDSTRVMAELYEVR